MHYTSIENIHEVINPLFLDDLKAEQADIKATSVAQTKRERDRVRKGEWKGGEVFGVRFFF